MSNQINLWDAVSKGELNGSKLSEIQRLELISRILTTTPVYTVAPFLPAMLSLDKHPYTLHDHFPFEVIFQTLMPRKLIMKTGRQVSKCLSYSKHNKIHLLDGRRVSADELKLGDRVQSMDKDFNIVGSMVLDKFPVGKKPMMKLTTQSGSEVYVAPTHPFFTTKGWVEAKNLSIKHYIGAVRKGGEFGEMTICPHRIAMTAMLIGNRYVMKTTSKYVHFYSDNKLIFNRFLSVVRALDLKHSIGNRVIRLIDNTAEVYDWLLRDRILGKPLHDRALPSWVFCLNESDTKDFLQDFWAVNGVLRREDGQNTINCQSTSKDLLLDVKSLLTKFGIHSTLRISRPSKTNKRGHYRLKISPVHVNSFMKLFHRDERMDLLSLDYVESKRFNTLPPELVENVIELEAYVRNTFKIPATMHRLQTKYKECTFPLLGKILSKLKHVCPDHDQYSRLTKFRKSDLVWERITSIEHLPAEECWDVEIDETHNYVVNSLISHNSTSIAAHGVILAAMAPGHKKKFDTLYVTPLFEQIRRFSNNYVRPFIVESPIKSLLISTSTENSVLQRSFRNGSIMHFSYAGLTADRTRGIRADRCAFDEVQDIDPEHFKVIEECMSHSEWGISQYTGTPKTKDNTIETKWEQSSQAEWVITCARGACSAENIPSMDQHLDKMIGPYRDDISEDSPGLVCYKCSRPLHPRNGRWRHRYPDRKFTFAGYHVPQVIMPVHYADPEKWSVLLSKRDTSSAATFYNEILGESYDIATKLLTKTELETAGCLNENDEDIAVQKCGMYINRVLAVDWGGGGEDGVSYTALAVLGFRTDGKIDVIFGKKSMTPHDHVAEARECRRLFQKFHCSILAHDYSGAGTLRETLLIQTGMAVERLMPIQYVRAASHNILTYIPASDQHPRSHYRVDKARSLQLTCYSIKLGQVKLFKYDFKSPEHPGLLHDFLALVENKVPTAHGSDMYTIQRNPLLSDDFAQAVNLGCCALWHMNNAWPNFSAIEARWRIDQETMNSVGQIDGTSWD